MPVPSANYPTPGTHAGLADRPGRRVALRNGRQRVWVALTAAGREAFAARVAELNRLAALTAPAKQGPGPEAARESEAEG